MRNIPSETKIVQEIKRIVFGKRVTCIHCSSRKVRFYAKNRRWFCRKCRKKFSLKSACWLKNMKISWVQFWILLQCWQKKYSVQQAQSEAGASEKTCRIWYEKFRNHLPRTAFFLEGEIEIDEMYTSREKGVFGAIKRHTKELVLWVPQDRPNKSYAKVFLESVIHPDSHLFTDGSLFYRNVRDWGFRDHTSENHSKFEFGETSQIEGLEF